MFSVMTARLFAAALCFWTALSTPVVAQEANDAPAARAPVVVELYTSQGCWQCARANRLMSSLSREGGVLPLTFSVEYWDYLGWRDTFAEQEFSQRQRAFADRLRGRRSTPQLVIDGERQVSGADWDLARTALQEVRAAPRAQSVRASIQRLPNNALRIILGSGPAVEADVWLVAFDPEPVGVVVTAGENASRTIWHYNLVRSLRRLGAWNGQAAYFEANRCSPQCAVLVQESNGGPILGAAYTQRRR